MNFYLTYYKRQFYDEKRGGWRDTDYTAESIVVIASDLLEAKIKIEKCLDKVETGKYRAILNGEIYECIGICGDIYPII